MEDEDFLAAVEADYKSAPVAEEPEAETPQEPTPQEPEQPAPEEPALELTELAPEPQPDQREKGFVPIAALLDERDRRKASDAELERFRQAQQAQAQQPVQMPDPYEDPEGFAAAQEARVSQALYQTNLRWSERLNIVEHGKETVEAAKDWGFKRCDTDPYFNAKVAASPDPIGFVVSEFRREEIASKVSLDDFSEFQAWKAAQAQLQQAAPAAPPNPASTIPPRSLASAPSAGNILTDPVQSDEEVFNEVFPKR